ncbi:FKBP-type peptidyl-prolyl cis-trans isomerase FklB [Bacteroides zoogleoformans]|uniref:Peptidyl-prolyl cis-trans isomerase n=1 Tax=Bacteroides zoogleoformans TaxID=28119 RepID=A0ABM6T7H8_9BACE|nr:FKBP-type peptidyl-prolyl cis-trans isomerase [Bacteroides zoogleoformans]AVM52801.1 peptidylprolyl isomerase [Bacteroides zoogleoformans]TWJ16604.1 FKBP-type peptidyl-prolyl cis-trans isomerase FklB [Bacteroides zoogleoformans]
MKRSSLLFLPLLWLLAGVFVSCEESEEAGKYGNWQERNKAFADSIKTLTGESYVFTAETADAMELGKLYAIQTTAGTSDGAQYVYCKKLVKNDTGERPLYAGYHSKVNTFYYGTYINGDKFDGNFSGYGAQDRAIPVPPVKGPTDFDAYTAFEVSKVVPGWTAALQFMRTGERWMLYIPWQSGYGTSNYTSQGSTKTVPGYSVLTFDVQLVSFAE